MSGKFVEKLTEIVSRRSILATMSAAAAAFVSGLFDVAFAGPPESCPPGFVPVGCCCLCQNSTSPCSGCACEWCWMCQVPQGTTCRRYKCRECYNSLLPCDSKCQNIKCSQAVYVVRPCEPVYDDEPLCPALPGDWDV